MHRVVCVCGGERGERNRRRMVSIIVYGPDWDYLAAQTTRSPGRTMSPRPSKDSLDR